MSEYQYYEFQAVDRPLTRRQVEKLSELSSRAQVTATSFVNVYNYGDFRGDPDRLIEKYFDAFLYIASFGTRRFMLRLPHTLLSFETAKAFKAGGCLSVRGRGDHVVLSFFADYEGDVGWDEGDGLLASMISVRAALMRGDYRALYLGWLLAVQFEEIDDDAREPAVPPGLAELDTPHDCLAEFLLIDTDLIAAAAEASAAQPNTSLSKSNIAAWISTAGELRERARIMGDAQREREEKEEARKTAKRERAAARARKKQLESLAGQESTLWSKVHKLIGTRQPKDYDGAVSVLQDLRDLAALQGGEGEFQREMSALHSEHARKYSLAKRFRAAELVGGDGEG